MIPDDVKEQESLFASNKVLKLKKALEYKFYSKGDEIIASRIDPKNGAKLLTQRWERMNIIRELKAEQWLFLREDAD